MSSEPTANRQNERQLEDVLGAYYMAIENGADPDPARLPQQHPELAAELAEYFRGQDQLDHLIAPLRTPSLPDARQENCHAGADLDMTRLCLAALDLSTSKLPANLQFGDYELRGVIAIGGMGIVYRARQKSLNRLVALKVIRDAWRSSPDAARRFRNEAEAVAQLDHPNIVPIHDVGEQDGCCFFSMKLIEGGNLSERLAEFQEPRAAAQLVATVARAVHHAHERGILHRDLKPSNVLIDERGQPLVVDFGLVRHVDGDSELTRTGDVLGTPSYMAPEQASGRKRSVTTATDVHGLGALLYTILTGLPPFRGATPLETLEEVREKTPQPPSAIRRLINRDLETICLKCLEKEPERRYASALEVAKDLERWLAGQPIVARPVGRLERGIRLVRRYPRASVLAIAIVALIATAATGLIMGTEARRNAAQLGQQVRERDLSLRRQQYARDVKQASQYWSDNRPQAALELLDRYLPAPGTDDLREFTWHYLHRLCKAGRLTLSGHKGEVYSSAFSPDGKYLATAGQDRTVRIWDAKTGETHLVLTGHAGEINWVAYSPDGRLLATASDDKTVRIWDSSSGRQISVLVGHTDEAVALGFSPDGKRLVSAARRGGVIIWDLGTSRQCESFAVATGNIQSLAISPDGGLLAIGGERVLIHDVATRRERARLTGEGLDQANCVEFSHDGKRLAATGTGGAVNVWDVCNWSLTTTFKDHPGKGHSVAFAPDDRSFVSVDEQGVICRFDLEFRSSRKIASGQDRLWSVSIAPDGKSVATASTDGSVKLWDLTRDLTCVSVPIISGTQGDWRASIAFREDGKSLVFLDFSGTATTINPKSGRVTSIHRFHDGDPACITAINDRSTAILTVGRCQDVCTVWDVDDHRALHRFRVNGFPVDALAIAPNSKWIVTKGRGDRDPLLRSLDGTIRASLEGREITDFVFSPKSGFIANRGWGVSAPVLGDVPSGTTRRAIEAGHSTSINAEAFSDDNKVLATGSLDGSVILWSVPDLKKIQEFPSVRSNICSLAFSPDGRSLAAGCSGGNIRLWDVHSGMELATLDGGADQVICARFSPDGLILATCCRYGHAPDCRFEIRLWGKTTSADERGFREVREGLLKDPVRSLSGVWSVGGHSDSMAYITARPDGALRLEDEKGTPMHGCVTGATSFHAFPSMTERSLTAVVDSTGDAVRWSDGTIWRKAGPFGVWYLDGRAGRKCFVLKSGKNRLGLCNEQFMWGAGHIEGQTIITDSKSSKWTPGLTGRISDDRQTILWSNGTRWLRKVQR